MAEYQYGGFPKGRIDPKIASSLWEQGYTDAEIAAAFGVTRDSAANWRRRNGLKPNVKAPERNKAVMNCAQRIAAINAEARAHGMTYGQWTGGGHASAGDRY